MDLRLRLSLVVRMAVAVAVLSTLLLALAAFATVIGGVFIGLALPGIVSMVVDTLLRVPRASSYLTVPPLVFALAAFVGLWVVYAGWSHVSRFTSGSFLIPPSDPLQLLVTLFTLGCLYELLFETVAALVGIVTGVIDAAWLIVGAVVVGVLVALVGLVVAVRDTVRSLQSTAVRTVESTDGSDDRLVGVVAKLSQLVDVPAPAIRVSATDRPEAFSVGAGSNATLVVSAGLLSLLTADELEAVLAHEISHLANGDGRVMAFALAPVVVAEDWLVEEPSDVGDWVWWVFAVALLRYGQFGVAFLSRGREWAADAGAAALTGSPAALASALVKLDGERGVPREDLREWSDAFVVLDVLPTLAPDSHDWPFRTHPPTAERVARLRRLDAEMESR